MKIVRGFLAGAAVLLLIVDICALLLTNNPYKDNPTGIFSAIVESVGGE